VQIAFNKDRVDVSCVFGPDPDLLVDIGLFPLIVPEPFVAIVAGELGPASDGVPLDAVAGLDKGGSGKV
jgi:hypothetical protein